MLSLRAHCVDVIRTCTCEIERVQNIAGRKELKEGAPGSGALRSEAGISSGLLHFALVCSAFTLH
jgi:hypothetical protein